MCSMLNTRRPRLCTILDRGRAQGGSRPPQVHALPSNSAKTAFNADPPASAEVSSTSDNKIARSLQLRPGVGVALIRLSTELGPAKCTLAFPVRQTTNIAALLAARPNECCDDLIPETDAAHSLRVSTLTQFHDRRLRGRLDEQIRNRLSLA